MLSSFLLFSFFFFFLFYLILFFMCFVCLWFILSFFLTRFYGWMEYFVQNFPLTFNPSEDSNTKTKIQEKQEPAYLALILMSENKKSPVHHKNERTNVLQHQHQLKQNKKHKKATCLQNIHTRTNKDDVFHISPLAGNFFIWHFSLRFVLIFLSQFFIFYFVYNDTHKHKQKRKMKHFCLLTCTYFVIKRILRVKFFPKQKTMSHSRMLSKTHKTKKLFFQSSFCCFNFQHLFVLFLCMQLCSEDTAAGTVLFFT